MNQNAKTVDTDNWQLITRHNRHDNTTFEQNPKSTHTIHIFNFDQPPQITKSQKNVMPTLRGLSLSQIIST